MSNEICIECSKHFESNWPTVKFCSDKCRLKHWRSEQKKKARVNWSVCPNCHQRFAHKNPKKLFCTPKCKTAYHRAELARQEEYDKYDRSHGYYAPPTPEEQLETMLKRVWLDRQNEIED